LLGKKEHRRALQFYRQALQLNRLVPRVPIAAGTPGGGGGGGGGRGGAGTRVAVDMFSTPGVAPMTPGVSGGPVTPLHEGAMATPASGRLAATLAAAATPATATAPTPAAAGASTASEEMLQEAPVKYKMGQCHLALKEWRAALAELETIPARCRTLPITLTLARTYQRTGQGLLATPDSAGTASRVSLKPLEQSHRHCLKGT
jgi:anaphase-promoting complex subunit 7